jgi:hypothetical protein
MYHFDEIVKKEFKLDENGQVFVSFRGAARICNIDHKALSHHFSGDLKASKLAKTLTEQGFEVGSFSQTGIPDTVLALVIEYYAFDANKTTQEALLACRAFAAIGIRVWIQQELGQQELIKQENNLESKLDQVIGIISHQQKELQELKTQIKKQEVVSQTLKSYKGITNVLNTSLNPEDEDYKKIEEIFKVVDALKLIDIIKYLRSDYFEDEVFLKKLINKVRRNAPGTLRDLSRQNIRKIKNTLVFTKKEVPSILNTIDRCIKELETTNVFEKNNDQLNLF